MSPVWLLVAAYALGCFTTGYYLVLWRARLDVRTTGSGATGATNVGRLLGRSAFLATLGLDAARGALAVGLGRIFGLDTLWLLLALLAVTAGHIWPIQLRFRGGKGIAPSHGGLLLFDWRLLLAALAAFALTYTFVRRFIVSGLIVVAAFPFALLLFRRSSLEAALFFLWSGAILFAHRDNLRKWRSTDQMRWGGSAGGR